MESRDNGNFNSSPVFNIGSGTRTSINELARKMIAISGLDIDPIYEKGTQNCGVILHSYPDILKAKRVLKFVAKKELETGLTELIGTMTSSK